MALNTDTSRQLRSLQDLRDLINAVNGADSSDESNFLEWKRDLDLTKAAGWFAISKCIIGMSNRPVQKASLVFGGCGYMVVGAEPGNTPGVFIPDLAQLEPWLVKYLGNDGPSWAPRSVDYNGQSVLVITIEPPSDSDKIHTLRKTYTPDSGKGGHQEGTIFVRHHAQSAPATTADIRDLEQRLLAGRSGVEAFGKVAADSLGAVRVLNFTQESEDARYAEEEEMVPPLKTSTSWSGPGLQGTVVPTVDHHRPEERDRYERERRQYLRDFKAALRPYALDMAGRRHRAPFALQITNESDTILTDLQIHVGLPDDLYAFATPGDYHVELPKRPKKPSSLLTGSLAAMYGGGFRPMDTSHMFDRFYIAEDRRSVTFSITDIHPHRAESTDSILLFTKLSEIGAGNIAGARWALPVSITAANRSGQWQGSVPVSAVVGVLAEESLLPPVGAPS
ncbi:hypothetical protein N8D77_12215 [Curtobacterium flaccumfaciens]|uniref:AlbA family DNA-binding domain-containing protein n=1 Tax=Curtobacterium TaxID=2034 RepID=UPI000F480D4A|nr:MULTISPECIES: hypothetical protein [Curtobacterium]ROR36406.1 hypothetical protein EDF63_0525 [Curtobacterium sp. JUb34]UXN20918.1 hypothetical protein N8D77_12215 [Curtobacterium flaccumfaciens pv. flaccumfaciens]